MIGGGDGRGTTEAFAKRLAGVRVQGGRDQREREGARERGKGEEKVGSGKVRDERPVRVKFPPPTN